MALETLQSHHRLITAMGVSSVVLGVLLGFLSELIRNTSCSDASCFDKPATLVVDIEQPESERISAITLPDLEIRTVPIAPQETAKAQSADTARSEQDADRDMDLDLLNELIPEQDWYSVAESSARQSVNDRFDQEEFRKSMWRKTGSVMFRDTGEFDFQEPATIIAAREFRVPLGVLGIGITIGGCFIGIPLAGIPVEERTAGPTVIYCTDLYK